MKYIKIAALGLCMTLGMFSCKKNELRQSNAVATEYSSMEFAAVGAESQTLPVYSDGSWTIENDSEWIDISPMNGYGNMNVTVTVADNLDGQEIDLPRKSNILFKSGSSDPAQNCKVLISQKGDKYKGLTPVTVAQAKDLEREKVAKFTSVQVMAASLTGMVIGDNTGVIYVEGVAAEVKVGDLISMTGEIKAVDEQHRSDPNVVVLDEETVEVISEGSADYSSAKDVSSSLDSYEGSYLQLVKVKGSIIGLANDDVLAGAAIRVPGATKRMMVVEAAPSVKMSAVNYHFVTVAGYFFGNMGSNPSFIPARVLEDGGVDESIIPVPKEPNTVLFADDFEWMDPFVQAAKAAGTNIDDSVGDNNASGAAPNLYTTASLAELGAEMVRRGYVDIAPAGKVMYPQANYWKFCKTSVNTGLQLPAIDYYGDLEISFDWSPQMTGSGNIDKVILVVMVTTGNSVVTATELSYEAWTKGQLAWHPAKARIQITPESLIHIRPISLEDYEGITQQRFYLDNIVVKVPGPDVDPVYADIQVDEDVLAFEGEGGQKILKITSDHDFVVNTPDKWITLENNHGDKNEETEVTVKVEASDLNKLREGKLTIISADSEKTIRIIQSAAGQDLDPFVSISKNTAEISGKAQSLTIGVQSTEEYSITLDASWVSLAPVTTSVVKKEDVTFAISANPDTKNGREAHVVFAIESKGVETVLTIKQAPGVPDDPNLLLMEDFDWMKEYFSAYETGSGKKVGDTIGSQSAGANSPQIYDSSFPEAFREEFVTRGWSDLNPSGKMVYINDAYLKLSKTGGNNTAVKLALEQYIQDAGEIDLELAFDYAMQIQGDGTVDAGPVIVLIDGDGTFENGTKVSSLFTSSQAKGELAWQKVTSVKINGASKNTKLIWVNGRVMKEDGTFNWSVGGAGRFFLDNIAVRKRIDPLPKGTVVFEDSFDWMKDILATADPAGTVVGNSVGDHNVAAAAPNVYTNAACAPLLEALTAKGYKDINQVYGKAQKVLYPQRDADGGYWKFGKTGWHSGFELPSFDKLKLATTVVLEFDWCLQLTGKGVLDYNDHHVSIVSGPGVVVTSTGTAAKSDLLKTEQKDDPAIVDEKFTSELTWQHVSIELQGITAETVLRISSDGATDTAADSVAATKCRRWFLDNIKVTVK